MVTKKRETRAEELTRLKKSYEKDAKTHKEASSSFPEAWKFQKKYQIKGDYTGQRTTKEVLKSRNDASNARLNQKEQRIEDLEKDKSKTKRALPKRNMRSTKNKKK